MKAIVGKEKTKGRRREIKGQGGVQAQGGWKLLAARDPGGVEEAGGPQIGSTACFGAIFREKDY